MTGSAQFGQPPATQNDYYIVKALLSRSPKLAAMDPAKGFPMPMPTNVPHDNGADRIYAGAIITIFFLLFITGIRVVSRRLAKPNALGWDDFFIVLAAASACSWFGMVLGMTARGGAGKRFYDLTYMEYYYFSLYGGIGVVLFYTTSALTKLSIICFNARLTGMTSVFWTWTHRAFFLVIVCYWLIAFFYQLLLCSPPFSNKSLIWQGQHGLSKCHKVAEPLGITTSVMHMAFDWVLLAVPIYLVLKLQMSWTKKLQCVIPLSLGALSSAGACVRTYDGLHPAKDPTHHLIYQTGWNVCDFLLAVTVTSLPACKKVLVDLTSTFSNRYFFTINGSRGSPNLGFSPPSSDDRSESQRRVTRDFDVESMATNQMVDDRSTRALYLKDWRTPSEGEVQIENEVLKAGGDGSNGNKNPFNDRRFLHGEEV